MVKALKSRVFKILFYITYPILIVALIALSVLWVLENREVNRLNDIYTEAQETLNVETKDKEGKQVTIDNLQETFREVASKNADLEKENEILKSSLKQLEETGQGRIAGKIFPFITATDSSFIQYQRVCAESITNKNIQVCRTVSTLDQEYNLSVPVGKYNLYAELFPTPAADTPYAKKKAYYNEYIKCVQESAAEKCNTKKTKAVEIDVKAGQTVSNVDPVAWQ